MDDKKYLRLRKIAGLTRYQLLLWGLDIKTITLNVVILLCLIVPGLEIRDILMQTGRSVSPWELWLLFWSENNTRIIMCVGFFLNTLDEMIPDHKQYFALIRGAKKAHILAIGINCVLKSIIYLTFIFVGLTAVFFPVIELSGTWSDGMKMLFYNNPIDMGLTIALDIPEKLLFSDPIAAFWMQSGLALLGTLCMSFFCAALQSLFGRVIGWIPVVVAVLLEEGIRMSLLSGDWKWISYLHLTDGGEAIWGNEISLKIAVIELLCIGVAGLVVYIAGFGKRDIS